MDEQVHDAMDKIFKGSIFESAGHGRLPAREGSTVLFVRRPEGLIEFKMAQSFIPTPYIDEIYETRRCGLANKEALDLFSTLSSHAFTRSGPGWKHEKCVHERLVMGGTALEIFRGPDKAFMQPSTRLLPGILDSFKVLGLDESFYWMPSGSNFDGIDSVLGTSDNCVYTIQATIAASHKDPIEGIKKVWGRFNQGIRAQRTWHHVVVTDAMSTATTNVNELSAKMATFTLGRGHDCVPVHVWGCVFVGAK